MPPVTRKVIHLQPSKHKTLVKHLYNVGPTLTLSMRNISEVVAHYLRNKITKKLLICHISKLDHMYHELTHCTFKRYQFHILKIFLVQK